MDQLTLFAGASPAKTSPLQDEGQDLLEQEAASGSSFTDSSQNFAPSGSSLRMSHCFGLEDWTKFSGASLRSATMRNGIVFPQPTLAHRISVKDSGLLPTPTTMGNQLAPSMMKHPGCRRLSEMAGGPGGMVSPKMYEWQMGFPEGWTDLSNSETQSSLKSLN